MTEPSLLLLIPAYNEESRIEQVLRDYGQYFRDHYKGKAEIVVVLNGCRDNTLGVVREVMRDFPALGFLNFSEPIGKGGALMLKIPRSPLFQSPPNPTTFPIRPCPKSCQRPKPTGTGTLPY